MAKEISIFWFRRDLRVEDNKALSEALRSGNEVLPIFIFDTNITSDLEEEDPRITFIHVCLNQINNRFKDKESGVLCLQGNPIDVLGNLIDKYNIKQVFTNEDYEPYAIKRDKEIESFLKEKGIQFKLFKDQVVFAKEEIVKDDGSPYTVFTPFKKKWLKKLTEDVSVLKENSIDYSGLKKEKFEMPSLSEIGFRESNIKVKPYKLEALSSYEETRNFPYKDTTSYLSPHLRFGTISIRELVNNFKSNEVFLSELIWREFFMQILYHFPRVVDENFRKKYDGINWRNNENEFEKWKKGETGYPLVDAGMRQLNQTGYMHNRVRMVVASFLCKHLLIDWRLGEAYFAKKLLDYELSSNNGNWQWAAGTGCDAAPYFRVFNPSEQLKKFDKSGEYIRKWISDFDSFNYPTPMVDHKDARQRALKVYKEGILD